MINTTTETKMQILQKGDGMLTTLRQDFKEYRSNRQEIRELKQQLGSMEHLTDTVMGSSDEWPYVKHPITVQGRNAAEETRILKQIKALEARCRRVEEEITKAPNSLTRRMLRLRYVHGLRWADVAARMGADVTEDAVKQRDRMFFKDR